MPATRRPTKKLFRQFNPHGKEDLNDWRTVFVECGDVTEYEPAIALCGSWKEWERFKVEWPEFRNKILPEWHEELEVKLRSSAIRSLCNRAVADKPDINAAKWIAEGKYKTRKAGRPSNEEIARETRIQAGIKDEIADDIERVGKVVNFAGHS